MRTLLNKAGNTGTADLTCADRGMNLPECMLRQVRNQMLPCVCLLVPRSGGAKRRTDRLIFQLGMGG